jgi:hypothetical protein
MTYSTLVAAGEKVAKILDLYASSDYYHAYSRKGAITIKK